MSRRTVAVVVPLMVLASCRGGEVGSTTTASTVPATTVLAVAPWTVPSLPTLPEISPSGPACTGSRVAFDRETTNAEEAADQRWQIVAASPDGGDEIVLLDAHDLGYQYLGEPAWSPDGTRLVLTAHDADGHRHFVIARCDGTIEASLDNLVTRTASYDVPIDTPSNAQWSPDGRWLAFVSADGLYLVDPGNTERPYHLAFGMSVARGRPTWSPDGTRLALGIEVGDQAEIVLVPIAGGPVATLTIAPAAEFQPAWSPDGSTIVYEREAVDGQGQIWSMGSDGSDPRALSPTGIAAYVPAWSPDGGRFAYVEDRGDGNTRIRVMGADGAGDRLLQAEDVSAHWEGWPSWTG